jgi:hypothetical protein
MNEQVATVLSKWISIYCPKTKKAFIKRLFIHGGTYTYSERNEFTGLTVAARNDLYPTVRMAISSVMPNVSRKTWGPTSIL